MSSTNRAGLRAGILGLMLGCVPAVWLVGLAAAPFRAGPNPMRADPPAETPAPPPPATVGGMQLGQPVVSAAQEELRKSFPFESLARRLDDETASSSAPAKGGPAPQMTEESGKRLTALEERMGSKQAVERSQRLMLLHADPVPRLPSTPLFGMYGGVGMLGQPAAQFGALGQPAGQIGSLGTFRLTREELELSPAPSLLFEAVRPPADDVGPSAAAFPPPKRGRLAALHADALFDFLNPAGFGYVQDREHVAGFEPHQFRHMPQTPTERVGSRTEKWAVVHLQLVSLLKHNGPVVYDSDILPSMAAANRPDTRPLTAFEEKALKTLRDGDDLAAESSGDRIRMMGSLRAEKQCLECHAVKRGDLLGAFSWELQRQTVGSP